MSETPDAGVPEAIRTTDGWQSVLSDMDATAASYRDRGWRALELHPGDSVLVDSAHRTGLDVLCSGPEFEELESLAETHDLTDVEVFAASNGGVRYLLIVETDPDAEVAVFVPAYYELTGSKEALESIVEEGTFRVFCRRMNNDFVAFEHDDIEPFVPDEHLDA